jgi:outer membrane receptor protein involved in Fe transport
VNVFVPAVNKGALSELEGAFFISDIPAGNYKVVFNGDGYKGDTAYNVVITAGETTELQRQMSSDTINTVVVYVMGQKNEGSEATAIEDTKKSDKIISVLSTEQIQKGQDRDAAEAIRRIPGVSLLDGRFIMVRGLSERYNSVWLNDAGAPSSETDSKAFSFDIIPSQLIDKIQIYKTASPDLPGDFAGGMAKIYTRASAQKKSLQINFQGSYRPGSTFDNFNFTAGSPTDFLGFDNGYRSIPSAVPSTNLDASSNSGLDKSAIAKSFVNDWGVHTRKALPDLRFNIFYTNKFNIKRCQVGSTSNINYANLNTVYKIHRTDWDSISPTKDLSDIQSTNTARLGIIQNFAFIFSKNFRMEFKNLFNQFGTQQNVLRSSNLVNQNNMEGYYFNYQSRTIYTTQLTSIVNSNDEKTQFSATIGYSYSFKNIPDFRRIAYTKSQDAPDSTYTAQVPPGTADPVNGGGRFYSKLHENVFSHNLNFKREMQLWNYKFTLNLGEYIELKSRDFSARTFGYTITPSSTSLQSNRQPIGQIFSPQNVGVPGGYSIDEITSRSDAYTAQNKLFAHYISLNLPFGKRIKILGGVRLENNTQSLQSYLNTSPISPSVNTLFLLPSVNGSFNFTPKSLIRAAYGKTLNRPEFREWSPFYFYDFEFNASTYGSLFPTVINPVGRILKVAQIQNFDLRYEYYPSPNEMFNIGVFYKKFKDPIQQVVQAASDDSRAFTYNNANSAYSMGIELDVRKNLAFLDNKFKTKFLSDIALVLNASLIKSQVYNTNVINQDLRSPLQGQSPYIINSGIYYQNDSTGWQASLLYNVFGARVFRFGTKSYPSYGEMPRNSLDLTISKVISKKITATVGIQDILNQPVLIVQDTNGNGKFERNGNDKNIVKYRKGSYFTAGIKFNIF